MSLRVGLVLGAAFPSGQGSQVYVAGMARALAERGHRVTVLAYGYGEGEPPAGVEQVGVPVPRFYRRTRSGPDAMKPLLDLALVAYARALDVDVLGAHNYEALAACLLARASRRGGPAVVYHNHTLLREELPLYSARARPLWAAVGGAADRWLPRHADAVLAITPAAATTLRALGCKDVEVVPPGLHAGDFDGVVPERLGPGKWLVYAGNPDAYQRLPVVLDAMEHLPGWRLLVVTGADWSDPRATVVHTRDWARVRNLIAGADVAALPRSIAGGYPLKLLNYLALGVPVVVAQGAAQGLPGEVVVPDGDPRAFAAGVLRARAPEGLEERVLSSESWAARAVAIERCYRRVTAAPQPS